MTEYEILMMNINITKLLTVCRECLSLAMTEGTKNVIDEMQRSRKLVHASSSHFIKLHQRVSGMTNTVITSAKCHYRSKPAYDV